MSARRALPWFTLALGVIALDQVTKQWVLATLVEGHANEVLPFLNLVLVHNPGAAFSILSDGSGWQRGFFIGVAVIASAWIAYLLFRYPNRTLFSVALALILGGALGNVIDRVIFGAVIDFIDVHVAGYHWPAFNVADSAITCGAMLLVIDSFRKRDHPATSEAPAK